MPSIVTPVPIADLTDWPTKRLLALRDALLRCEDSFDCSDAHFDEIDPARIRFKADPRWAELYDATRAALRAREHVPSRRERQLQRTRDAAARSRGREPRPKRGAR